MSSMRDRDHLEGPDIRGNVDRGGDRDKDRHGAEAEQFLGAVEYPIRKGDLLQRATQHGAPEDVRRLLDKLPDREFGSIVEVSRAIGELSWEDDEGDAA
jgi:hypothetical protein